jgi:hypothetical protein
MFGDDFKAILRLIRLRGYSSFGRFLQRKTVYGFMLQVCEPCQAR